MKTEDLVAALHLALDERLAHGLKPSSSKPFRSAINALCRFANVQKSHESNLSKLISAFDAHLRAQIGNTSTVGTYHSYLKTLFGIAHAEGLLDCNPYDTFTPRRTWHTRSRASLSDSDVLKLENIDRSTLAPNTSTVLDMFLFSVYTGLRISDCRKVSFLNIVCSDIPRISTS